MTEGKVDSYNTKSLEFSPSKVFFQHQKELVQKIANYIAMYNNMLNGADVIVMTAGVGENSKTTRKEICEKIASLGVKIDDAKNDFRGEFREISADDSKIPVYVIPTNEELMIAQDTYNLVK